MITTEEKSIIIVQEGETLELPTLHAKPGISVVEIHLKPSSKLRLAYIQNANAGSHSMMTIKISMEREAVCETFAAMIGGTSSSLFMKTSLIGDGASLRERTLYFGYENQIFDMFSITTLEGVGTRAEIESKGILTGSAQARFDGNIHIQQTAKRANARLVEHTLLLSPLAKMNAIPGLKIDTNDVMATHSTSITRIDDEQLFYAGSRGIPEHKAIKLIAEGFLASLYNDPPFVENVDQLIQEKLCRL